MRRALIVGIDGYTFGELSGAVNDANAITEYLQENEDGSLNFDCQTLTAADKGKVEISRVTLKEMMHSLFTNEAEVALFYFAGHGVETDFGSFITTQDSYKFDEGVSLYDILIMANKSKAREVIIILDCCYSGHFGNNPLTGSRISNIREGVSILTSSRDHQTSKEVNGHGIFTRILIEALEGEAADTLGKVNIASIYQYLDQVMSPWEQRPTFKSNVSTMITLRQCYPRISPKVLRKLSDYFDNENSEIRLGPEYEINADPSNEEKEIIYAHLLMFASAGLVSPSHDDDKDLHETLIHERTCELTRLGQFYHKMALKKRF